LVGYVDQVGCVSLARLVKNMFSGFFFTFESSVISETTPLVTLIKD